MHRSRTISAQFWRDDRIKQLTDKAKLLAIALNNFADDEGLLMWSRPLCKSYAFEGRNMTFERVGKLMAELISSKLVLPYDEKHAMLIYFHKEQKICRAKPSKLPAPDLTRPEVQQTYFDRDEAQCCVCDAKIETTDLASAIVRVKEGSDYPSNIRVAHVECQHGDYPAIMGKVKPTKAKVVWHNAGRWAATWKLHYMGVMPMSKVKTTCLRLEREYGDLVFVAWDNYCAENDARYNPSLWKFASTAGNWMPQGATGATGAHEHEDSGERYWGRRVEDVEDNDAKGDGHEDQG